MNPILDMRSISKAFAGVKALSDVSFSVEPGGIGLTWETDVRSHWRDAGVFAVTDLEWRGLSLTAGGR